MSSMVLLGCSQEPPQPTGTHPNGNVSLVNNKAIGSCTNAYHGNYPGGPYAYPCADHDYWCDSRSSPTCYTNTCNGNRYSYCCTV
jgi:hypothetical protein